MNFGNYILNSIKRIYKKQTTKIVVNNSLTEIIINKSGLKQGDALSMFLYILNNEEVLISIMLNNDIKGFKLNIFKSIESKAFGYADDNTGTVVQYNSIEKIFHEFKEWGKVSGSKINEEKTRILAINSLHNSYNCIQFVKSIKILGIEFNNKGISDNNIRAAIRKIEISINLWSSIKFNMIDRIITVKTFILSKLWFLANFICLEKQNMNQINQMVYKYIWNDAIEMIKRKTLVLPYESGGLSSVCIKTKIQAISIQNFIYMVKNKDRLYYQLSVKYLRFNMRQFINKGFNLIPGGLNGKIPKYYQEMNKYIKNFKLIEKDFHQKINTMTCKSIYCMILNQNSERPKIEAKYIFQDWDQVYTRIHETHENSEVRAFLYKLLHEALPCNQRFNNREKISCYFCNQNQESDDHVFYECSQTKLMFESVKRKLNNQKYCLNKINFWFNIESTKHDYKIISLFMYTVWIIRNNIRQLKHNSNIDQDFRCTFKQINNN